MDRRKYLASQMGKTIKAPGSHMPHSAVGIILKTNRKKSALRNSGVEEDVTSKDKPIETYNPYPFEYLGENM